MSSVSIFKSLEGRQRILAEYNKLLAASGIAPVRLSFVLRVLIYSLRGGQGGEAITRMVYGKDQIPQVVIDTINIISANYSPDTGHVIFNVLDRVLPFLKSC